MLEPSDFVAVHLNVIDYLLAFIYFWLHSVACY